MAGSFKFDAARFGKSLRKAVGDVVANATITVPCPECGHENRVKGDDIARERTFTCRGCRKQVKMHDKGDGFAKIVKGN